jgi:hypothetical protein
MQRDPPERGPFDEVVRPYVRGMLLGPFDFDGRQVAYALRSCDNRAEILVAPADGAPIIERVLCPGHVASRVTTLRAGRQRVPLALNCTRGCTGRLRTMRVTRRGHPRIALGRYTNFVYPPSRQSHRIDAPLSSHARRLVRQAPRLPATVELQLNDRAQRPHIQHRRVLIRAEAVDAVGTRE